MAGRGMIWTPEDQLTIFDIDPAEEIKRSLRTPKRLTADHFDETKTNPNFISYLKASNKRIGDTCKLSESKKWIDTQVSDFKRSHGLTDSDMLNRIDGWPEKLREFLRDVAKT